MSRIKWGDTGNRYYEAGVDRGVLFLEGEFGIPWSGLSAVNEAPTGGEPRPYYLDGIKYQNLSAKEEFEATINAYGAPIEFGVCDGTKNLGRGLFATQQKRKQFDFSYRTKVGNDVLGIDFGYKIHLVYNALAKPSSRNQQTVTNTPSPLSLSWGITTIPERTSGIRPTSHFVVDSRTAHPVVLAYLEGILYGMPGYESRMPSVAELVTLFNWPVPDLDVALNLLGAGSPDKMRVTNLYVNPSIEASGSGLNTAYTNLALNPLQAAGVAGLQTNNASFYSVTRGVTLPVATPDGILTGAVGTPASTNTTRTLLSAYNVDALSNTGPARVVGSWVRVNRGGYSATIGGGPSVPLIANAWVWVKSGAIAANVHNSIIVTHETAVVPETDLVWVTGTTGLAGTIAPEFAIWGSMSLYDVDFTATWLGGINSSQTALRGLVPATIAAVSTAWAAVFQSKKWSYYGQYSLRVGAYGSSAVIVNTSIAAFSNLALTTEVNKRYTVTCKVRKDAPTSVLDTFYGAIGIYDGSAIAYSPKTDNVAGVYEPRITALRTGSVFQLRLINSSPRTSAPDVYFDGITMVEGDYDGPPIVPGSPLVYRKQVLVPEWTGSPDNSTSFFEYYLQLTEAAKPGDAYIIEGRMYVFVDGLWQAIATLPE